MILAKFYSNIAAVVGSALGVVRHACPAGVRYLSSRARLVFGGIQWRIVHHKKTAKNAKALLANQAISAPTKTLVLIYNSMFGMPAPLDELELPRGCAFTVNRRYWNEASAVVYHIPTLRRLPRRRRPDGQRWAAWFLESGVQYPVLNDPLFMSRFDLTISFRRQADIRDPCFLPPFNQLVNARPKPKCRENALAFFFSYLGERSGRNAYARELVRHIDAHGYGRFLRNRTLPNDSGRPTKLQVLSGYKFNLAFENSIEEDYVTEKFFDPLEAGCVPVYLGAPNIDDYAPGDHCYIHVADFNGPKQLAEYLLDLNEDEEAYNAYHAWRRRPPRTAYRRLCEERLVHPFVRLCRLLQNSRGPFHE